MQSARVVVDRDGIIENCHTVHAAIVDGNGNLLYALGDSARVTLLRSCAKPLQALAILETGCGDQFDDADVALVCASHSSEPDHIARALAMLERAGAQESDLRCDGHASLDPRVERSWARMEHQPTPINNNCSGKHAGMIAGSKELGLSSADYHKPGHPMEVHVRRVIEEVLTTGIPHNDQVRWATDGCNLPAPAARLDTMAATYAGFARSRDRVSCGMSDLDVRTRYKSRIFESLTRYPEMVGGSDRFCTVLMRAYEGRLIGKLGADGCYGIAVRADRMITTGHPNREVMGIAVKIEDGNVDILYVAYWKSCVNWASSQTNRSMRWMLKPFDVSHWPIVAIP